MIDCIDEVFQLPREKLDKCGKEGRDLRSRTIKTSLIREMVIQNKYGHIVFLHNKRQTFQSHALLNQESGKATFIGKAKRKLQKTT